MRFRFASGAIVALCLVAGMGQSFGTAPSASSPNSTANAAAGNTKPATPTAQSSAPEAKKDADRNAKIQKSLGDLAESVNKVLPDILAAQKSVMEAARDATNAAKETTAAVNNARAADGATPSPENVETGSDYIKSLSRLLRSPGFIFGIACSLVSGVGYIVLEIRIRRLKELLGDAHKNRSNLQLQIAELKGDLKAFLVKLADAKNSSGQKSSVGRAVPESPLPDNRQDSNPRTDAEVSCQKLGSRVIDDPDLLREVVKVSYSIVGRGVASNSDELTGHLLAELEDNRPATKEKLQAAGFVRLSGRSSASLEEANSDPDMFALEFNDCALLVPSGRKGFKPVLAQYFRDADSGSWPQWREPATLKKGSTGNLEVDKKGRAGK